MLHPWIDTNCLLQHKFSEWKLHLLPDVWEWSVLVLRFCFKMILICEAWWFAEQATSRASKQSLSTHIHFWEFRLYLYSYNSYEIIPARRTFVNLVLPFFQVFSRSVKLVSFPKSEGQTRPVCWVSHPHRCSEEGQDCWLCDPYRNKMTTRWHQT